MNLKGGPVRPRLVELVCALTAVSAAVLPRIVTAAPHRNRGLTITAVPNPIDAGQGVLIYGRLTVPPVAGRTLFLYRRLAGSREGFQRVGTATTDRHGYYDFTRPDGAISTNRSWFVLEHGSEGDVHSRTIHESVRALVTLDAPPSSVVTGKPVLLTGQVTPRHAGERVALQEENGASDDWRTIATGKLDSSSSYAIAHTWRIPAVHELRVLFAGDERNVRGISRPRPLSVQQAEVPDFTIVGSAPVIPEGSTVTISGVLYSSGTTTPEPATVVALWARLPGQAHFHSLRSTVTGPDGGYSFGEMPSVNTYYQARAVFTASRRSAILLAGVRDIVTMKPGSTSSTVGGAATFSGNVDPDKAGHWIYLQRLGIDGDWHSIRATRVRSDSTFTFTLRFAQSGAAKLRARILSDQLNVGAASAPVTIDVSPASGP
jgi:hypothetical protein